MALYSLLLLIPFSTALLSPEELSKLETGVFQVIRSVPRDEAQLSFLTQLYENSEENNLDFWQEPRGVGSVVDIMVGESTNAALVSTLTRHNLTHTVTIPDVEKLTKERASKSEFRRIFFPKRRDSFSRAYYDFQRYHEFDDMREYMENVAREYPEIAELETIGRSHEDRPIQILKIGNRDRSWGKKGLWVDGGIHAREWAAPHVALFFIHQLVSQYGRDAEMTHLVDNLNWYIAPMTNPDGYIHSRSASHPNVRMWRKNRSPNECGRRKCCKGVDLNRNFDFHWMEAGSSSNPCSEVFAGTAAFSEPESKAVRDFILGRGAELQGFISLHTYSQLWVHAFGHARHVYPADKSELLILGKKAAKALYSLYHTKYKIGSGADALYPASGGSDDWAKDKAQIKFVYLLELRPSEEEWDGFILDELQLLPTGRETWEGLKVVANEILQRSNRGFTPREEDVTTTTTTEAPPPPQSDCSDLRYSCARWAATTRAGVENCLTVRAFMREQCRLSCSKRFAGFC